MAFMPTLCHVTNTRLEVATTWQCWWRQNDAAQPHFAGELNLSSGDLASRISSARPHIGKGVVVKVIFSGAVSVAGPGGNGPNPPEPIGYKVMDGGTLVWQQMGDGEEVLKEANNRAAQRRSQKQAEVLSNFTGTYGRWANMVANSASPAIQQALNLGDARQFMRYVNPNSLVMREEVAGEGEASDAQNVYRELPLRAILLDLLSSKAMRDRHGLLMKGADQRSINFWFGKTFGRTPSPGELDALMKVVETFGYQSLFGCIAYSDEYAKLFGDGIPGTELTGSGLLIEGEVINRS